MEKGVLYLVLASLVLALILSQACGKQETLPSSESIPQSSQDPTTTIIETSKIIDAAIKQNDPTLCEQILDQGYQDQCVKLVSESQK